MDILHWEIDGADALSYGAEPATQADVTLQKKKNFRHAFSYNWKALSAWQILGHSVFKWQIFMVDENEPCSADIGNVLLFPSFSFFKG